MGKRRRARELVLQGLYALDIASNPVDAVLNDITQFHGNDEEMSHFVNSLLKKAFEHKEELDYEVSSTVKNWDFSRIALVDRIILRLALCELIYFYEIPPKVTINEAIDLAKKYSTGESGRFVNGILDALYQKLIAEKRIIKKGQGLLE